MGKRRSFFNNPFIFLPALLSLCNDPSASSCQQISSAFKKHLSRLPDKSILRLRDCLGGLWPVEVDRVGGDWFFHHGWETFVADHTIAFGDFIVFLHDGRFGFDVCGCEKAATNCEPAD